MESTLKGRTALEYRYKESSCLIIDDSLKTIQTFTPFLCELCAFAVKKTYPQFAVKKPAAIAPSPSKPYFYEALIFPEKE